MADVFRRPDSVGVTTQPRPVEPLDLRDNIRRGAHKICSWILGLPMIPLPWPELVRLCCTIYFDVDSTICPYRGMLGISGTGQRKLHIIIRTIFTCV